MLLNYIKIAWKVLQRRKFFSFISLFGISFTLMVVIVLIALIDHLTGAYAPEQNRSRSLYIHSVRLSNEKTGNQTYGFASWKYFKEYLRTMKTPEVISITSMPAAFNLFRDKQKVETYLKYTDANFWKVMNFTFIAGTPYTQQAYNNGDLVAVISQQVQKEYFGGASAIGQTLEIEQQKMRVVGVVEDVPITRVFSSAGIYVPFTASQTYRTQEGYLGNEMAILQAKDEADFEKIKAEYRQITEKVPLPDPQKYDTFSSNADTYANGFLLSMTNGAFSLDFVYNLLTIFVLLFLLLPIVNLININISRTLERASEIGVRKAFGASTRHLLLQFVIENVFITLLGGLLSVCLAGLMLWGINQSAVIPHSSLIISIKVLAYALGVSLFFGLLSGVYPAYRMSKLPLVTALKGGVS